MAGKGPRKTDNAEMLSVQIDKLGEVTGGNEMLTQIGSCWQWWGAGALVQIGGGMLGLEC